MDSERERFDAGLGFVNVQTHARPGLFSVLERPLRRYFDGREPLALVLTQSLDMYGMVYL